MILKMRIKTDRYRFLWLKHVTGFNPMVHCARCLLGTYSKVIPYRGAREGVDIEAEIEDLGAPYLYLCGVTGKYADNLHIAARPMPSGLIQYEDERIEVQIIGAERIDIPRLPEDVEATMPREFHTCRNYQFGRHVFGNEGQIREIVREIIGEGIDSR